MADTLLSMDQAADRLAISRRTLFRLVARGEGPRRTRIGRRVFISDRELDRFIEQASEPVRQQ